MKGLIEKLQHVGDCVARFEKNNDLTIAETVTIAKARAALAAAISKLSAAQRSIEKRTCGRHRTLRSIEKWQQA